MQEAIGIIMKKRLIMAYERFRLRWLHEGNERIAQKKWT